MTPGEMRQRIGRDARLHPKTVTEASQRLRPLGAPSEASPTVRMGLPTWHDLDPEVRETAKALANHDMSLIRVLSTTEALVVNHPNWMPNWNHPRLRRERDV